MIQDGLGQSRNIVSRISEGNRLSTKGRDGEQEEKRSGKVNRRPHDSPVRYRLLEACSGNF
jgi:hypothetical protein